MSSENSREHGAVAPNDVAKLLTSEALDRARLPLEQAATLPADAFTSREVWEFEREHVLAHSWLCAGRLEQVPNPGDFVCLDLLGDKLVMVRDQAGTVRVLSRACRHRGAEVVTGSGKTRSFQCPYHAWTYQLDGTLLGAPLMDGERRFDRSACRLPEIRSEVWNGFVFVNFAGNAEPLAAALEPLDRALANHGMADLVAVETARYESRFNWKVLVDNFMEAYHHIAIHRDTLESTFPASCSFTRKEDGPFSVLVMPPALGGAGADLDPSLPLVGPLDPAERQQLLAAVVYPFHLFAPGPTSMAWYQLFPTRHDRFELRIYNCFRPEALETDEGRAAIDAHHALVRHVHEQDIAACEMTWSGLQARSFDAGVLAPLEMPLWRFNQWWIERMVRAADDLRSGGPGR